MTLLSVNINKIATLRNARGGNIPNLVQVAKDCQKFGAQGITMHPRPDQRHIRHQDIQDLYPHIQVELNIEGYPDTRYLTLVRAHPPTQATLVPDAPEALTSTQGWDFNTKTIDQLRLVLPELHALGTRSALFIEPDSKAVLAAHACGAQRVELYTGHYAQAFAQGKVDQIVPNYVQAAKQAKALNMGINAGHDLSLDNLNPFLQQIPFIDEVSIGHALICDALYYGLENTLLLYKKACQVD